MHFFTRKIFYKIKITENIERHLFHFKDKTHSLCKQLQLTPLFWSFVFYGNSDDYTVFQKWKKIILVYLKLVVSKGEKKQQQRDS